MNELLDGFIEILHFIDQLVISPTLDRVHIEGLYFIPSLFVAVIFLLIKKGGMSSSRFHAAFLTTRIWKSKTVITDYWSFFINLVILGLFGMLLAALFAGKGVVQSEEVARFITGITGDISFIEHPVVAAVAGTFFSFIVLELFYYLYHRWLHSYELPWKFHSRHHSATLLTPLTNYRGHPLESIVKLAVTYSASIVVGGFAVVLSSGEVEEIVILGTNLFAFFIVVFGGMLNHTHIFLRFPKSISYIVMSPAMHQVHHSEYVEHRNKNYGNYLSLWDWVFGTMHIPEKNEKVKFGIGVDSHEHNNIWVFMFGKSLYERARAVSLGRLNSESRLNERRRSDSQILD